MDSRVAKIYFLCLGVFVFTGLLIGLSFLNGYEYYQKQTYNNLPSVTQPAPIQHYEQQRDNSVAMTEANNLAEKSNVNSSVNVNSSILISLPGVDVTQNNLLMFTFLLLANMMFVNVTGIFTPRGYDRDMIAIMVGTIMTLVTWNIFF